MSQSYKIFIGKHKIGTTQLEKADPPMGVVFGQVNLIDIASGYDFLKKYCLDNKVGFNDHPKEKLILTFNIPNLQVFNESGKEIKGLACSIAGMDSDCFEVSIEGIDYPFYAKEFPQHVKAYEEMFKGK